ncbi:MAG TPA: hypothetical protein VEB64_01495 [Azospirillaceae bacterium]|nr:hypothetical protein [Azospirillaceae bacterium]
MSDPLIATAGQGLQPLYPQMAARLDSVESLRELSAAMRMIVEEVVRLYPADKVRQAAKLVASEHMALLKDMAADANMEMARIVSKKQVLFLLAATKGCPPCAPAPMAARPPAPVPAPPPLPAPSSDAAVAEDSTPSFEVDGQTIDVFFPDFLGKYVAWQLSPFHVTQTRNPSRLPCFLAPDFADRLAAVIRMIVGPHLLEYRVMKVRLVETFNIADQGLPVMVEIVQRPNDNPIHHTWDIFWQPPANGAKPAPNDRRGKLLDSAWARLNAAGFGELTERDIDVIRSLIRLPVARAVEELSAARDCLVKIRDGRMRPAYIRERIEKMVLGSDTPRYMAELILLKLVAEDPLFFNDEWAKWFSTGFRDRPDAIPLFNRWYEDVRAAVG